MKCLNFLKLIRDDKSGATAIEYTLIASLIFLVIVGSVSSVGANLGASYDDTASKVSSAL